MPRARKVYHAASTSRKQSYSPEAFAINNTYSDPDYDYFEASWSSTVAGQTIDKHWDFTIGGGIKPVFELINSKGKDQKQIEEALKKYDDLKNQLIDIDQRPNISFKKTIRDGAIMAKVFGRCAIAFEPDGLAIPESLYIIHPRDLGRPYTKQNYALSSVRVNSLKESIMAEDMIYLVNKPNSPIRRQLWYGYSEMQRVVGAARALRRIVEYDSPEIVESLWAKYAMIFVNTQGMTASQADAQLQRVGDGMKPGAFNVLAGKKGEDIDALELDMKAQVGDLVQLVDNYERLIIGNWGVPGPLMGREEDSNMATLFGKIKLYIAGPVASDREWLSDIISKQWYERNIQRINPEALKEIRVKAEFEPVVIESWVDMVEPMVKLQQLIGEIPVEMLTDMLHLEQYKDLIAEVIKKKEAEKQKMMAQNPPTNDKQPFPDNKQGAQ